MTKAQRPPVFKLVGKRGRYQLIKDEVLIFTGSNRERLRGIQYFLEQNPEYAAAPEMLGTLKAIVAAKEIETAYLAERARAVIAKATVQTA